MEPFTIEQDSDRGRRSAGSSKCTVFNFLFTFAVVLLSGLIIAVLFNFIKEGNHRHDAPEILASSIEGEMPEDEEVCENDFCLSKECITTTARIMKLREKSQDPCENFYEYACGGYDNERYVRYGETVYDPHTEVRDNLDINVKKLMEEESEGKSPVFLKAQKLYESCMDYEKREEEKSAPLLKFFSDHYIQWPLQPNASEPDTSWQHIVKVMSKHGMDLLFKPSYSGHSDQNLNIMLSCEVPLLSPEVYLNPTNENSTFLLDFYENVVLIFFDKLGVERDNAKKMFSDILKLETSLAQTFAVGENVIDEDCKKPCTKSWCPPCEEPTDQNTWLTSENRQLLRELFAAILNHPADKLEVANYCKGNMNEILNILSSTSKKTVVNYLGWLATSQLLQFLDNKHQTLFNHYHDRLLKDSLGVPISQWRECSRLMRNTMDVVLSKGLLDKGYFNDKQLEEVRRRFRETKLALRMLIHSYYLNNATETQLLQKLGSMQLEFGFPSIINEPNRLNRMFEGFDVDESKTFFHNLMNFKAFERNRNNRAMLFEDVMPIVQSSLATNVYYEAVENTVVMDFGMLVSPVFKYGPGLPKYLEYGQNLPLAKAMSNSFNIGVFLEGGNNMEDVPEEIQQRAYAFRLCMAQQYANDVASPAESTDETTKDNSQDLASFIITNMGLKFHLAHFPDEGNWKLPGLDLTRDQIYFIQAAQSFCELRERTFSYEDKRSKPKLVNQMLSNMDNFAEAFQCPERSPMNPSAKCRW